MQHRGRVLRGILPLLALVWATATWHDCYLAGMRVEAASTASSEPCAHHQLLEVAVEFALALPADDALPSCDEVADVAPDLRPAAHELLALRIAGFVPAPIDTDNPAAASHAARATGGPPDRPLQARPARLLI